MFFVMRPQLSEMFSFSIIKDRSHQGKFLISTCIEYSVYSLIQDFLKKKIKDFVSVTELLAFKKLSRIPA